MSEEGKEKTQDKNTQNKEGGSSQPQRFTLEEFKQGKWRDALSEDIASDSTLADYKDFESVVKSHNHLQRQFGRDKIVIPKDDDKEGWKEVRKKLGWPEDRKEYDFSRPEEYPEDIPYDEDFESFYKRKAHNAGLSKKQAKKLYHKMVRYNADRFKEMVGSHTERVQGDYDKLKKEWGDKYDSNVKIARQFINEHTDKSFKEWMDNSGMKDEPQLLKMAAAAGKALKPRTPGPGEKPKPRLSKSEAKSKMNKLMEDSAYFDNRNPKHDDVVKEVERLAKIVWPDE